MTTADIKTGDNGDAKTANRRANGRSVARLLAVQALYQMDLTGVSADAVVEEFMQYRLGRDASRSLFLDLVRGAAGVKEELLEVVGGALKDKSRLQRLEIVLRAIMVCGAYELRARKDVPPRVTINEYVEITHRFFGGKEPGLVNGVLDRLGHTLRAGEMGGHDNDAANDAG